MTEQNFEAMRRTMVATQLRTTGVDDPRVLAAMSAVARERFVPAERRAMAYADAIVPLAGGRGLNPPMTLGLMLREARLRGDERVLVVGAATGYAAAVLARLAATVVAIEESSDLVSFAREVLGDLPVELIEAPLAAGHRAGAPFDFILVDGAIETLPAELVDQLCERGRIVLARVDSGVSRLCLGQRIAGSVAPACFADASAVRLPGFSPPASFSF